MTRNNLLLLDNALDHRIYRPVEHWSKVLGFTPDHIHVPSGATLPAADNYTHVILSGSEDTIVERAPWAENELRWLREAIAAGLRILGSCWGHQLIAAAMGGPACVRHAVRPEIGWLRIKVLDSGGILPKSEFDAFAFHFDEVVAGSHPDIRILARSSTCAVHALRWGNLPVWGIQAHPEIDPEDAKQLISTASIFWPDQAVIFRKALSKKVDDSRAIGKIVRRFLKT